MTIDTTALEQPIVWMPVDEVREYDLNAKEHPPEQIVLLAKSIAEYGWTTPLLIDANKELIAGHGRMAAARHLGVATVPTVCLGHLTPEQARSYRLADNRLAELGIWNPEALKLELGALSDLKLDLAGIGFDSTAILSMLPREAEAEQAKLRQGALADDFIEPPLALLRSDTGRWQARKADWLARMPIDYDADLGRDHALLIGDPAGRRDPQFYAKKAKVEARLGREITYDEFLANYYTRPEGRLGTGTSQFDPVLAEIMTTWFSAPGMLLIDPFAGDVERGLVAAAKGRAYHGMDVRPEQCVANAEAAERMGCTPIPLWTHGDSANSHHVWEPESADLAFTCPPYWCLEKYSDDPADLSNMRLEDFTAAHNSIIAQCARALRPNRFAAWVIGDCRDPKSGRWARLQDRTIDGFEAAGMQLHSEIIFATPIGSKSIVARKAMQAKRTIYVRHEYVLVFCKGDPAKAAKDLGPVEVGDLPDDSTPANT